MTVPALNQFLVETKTDINYKAVDTLIMGNEAADLDSMASAVALARITAAAENKTVVPLMPINRADFKLRTEAVYVFTQAGIDTDSLVFLDDVNLDNLMDRVKNLVLVDHNKLSGTFEAYADKVSCILDHHADDGLYPKAAPRRIEPVGSTATLVGEILIQDHPQCMETGLAVLLLGTILLDTVNLDPGAGRVTPKDETVAHALMPACGLDQEAFFQAVQTAKFDTASLSTFDLLRKDYKEFKFGAVRCGIASALLSLSQWEEKDMELCLGFETYARRRHLDILISMNAYTDPDFNRDLAVYATDPGAHDRLIQALNENGLDLSAMSLDKAAPCLEGKISFHAQKNLGISRKKLSPILDTYFTR